MARGDEQDRQVPSLSPIRDALRDNLKELPKVLAGIVVGIVLLMLGVGLFGPLNDQERASLHAYQMAADWKLTAYPSRGAEAPLVVDPSVTQVACEALRAHYLRQALDQGNALPDIRCEQTHSLTERSYMRLLALRERWNTTRAPAKPHQ